MDGSAGQLGLSARLGRAAWLQVELWLRQSEQWLGGALGEAGGGEVVGATR